MVGFPNKPMGFPTKNDQHLGCEMGVPPFKETPKFGESHVLPKANMAPASRPSQKETHLPILVCSGAIYVSFRR